MTSPTLDRERLQAALASLNLSLEAELTQFRCHRLVQSHRPLETPDPNSQALPLLDPPPPEQTPPLSVMAAAPTPPPVPDPLNSVAEAPPTATEPEEFIDFDPAELAGLLPQSYTSGAPASAPPPAQAAPKRPFASTRELVKQARQHHRPWFQQQERNSQHHFQRWLIVIGILAGCGGGILFWITRQPSLVEGVNEPAPETTAAAPLAGPNMAAREFPDVNRSTLAQLQPAPANDPSPVPAPAEPPVNDAKVFIEKAANGRYYVLAPYNEAADLAKVQEILPDAFLVGGGAETKIQLGMFEDEDSAQRLVNQVRDRL